MNNQTTLYCPKCKNKITVYHLDWFALVCIHCKKEITKNQFLIDRIQQVEHYQKLIVEIDPNILNTDWKM